MTNRVWWITGAVVVAGIVFGLGVILGLMVDDDGEARGRDDEAADERDGDDDDDRDGGGAEDDGERLDGREIGRLGPLVEQFLDSLAERFEGRLDDGEGLGRDRRFRLFPEGFELPEDFALPDGFEFPEDFALPDRFELPEDFELPGGSSGLGECLGDGLDELFGEGDAPFGERARRLWERCTA